MGEVGACLVMNDTVALRTKKPTPLSTRALAAYMTWKQFDLLLLLSTEGASTASALSHDIADIKDYDQRHGGAFYTGVNYSSIYSSLRTLESRNLVQRHIARNGLIEWTATSRGVKALESLT
jgi:DNA-binding PadR family transcriptional regulator